jgi:hypothetical protein
VIRKLVRDVRIEGVDGGHVDEPRARVAANRNGHEPPAHLVGKLVDERREWDDGREKWNHAVGKLSFQHLLGEVPELQHGSHERNLCNELAIKAGFDFRRGDGARCNQATPELDGHRATLSSAPLTPRDRKFC